jgi:hypothetical protein
MAYAIYHCMTNIKFKIAMLIIVIMGMRQAIACDEDIGPKETEQEIKELERELNKELQNEKQTVNNNPTDSSVRSVGDQPKLIRKRNR